MTTSICAYCRRPYIKDVWEGSRRWCRKCKIYVCKYCASERANTCGYCGSPVVRSGGKVLYLVSLLLGVLVLVIGGLVFMGASSMEPIMEKYQNMKIMSIQEVNNNATDGDLIKLWGTMESESPSSSICIDGHYRYGFSHRKRERTWVWDGGEFYLKDDSGKIFVQVPKDDCTIERYGSTWRNGDKACIIGEVSSKYDPETGKVTKSINAIYVAEVPDNFYHYPPVSLIAIIVTTVLTLLFFVIGFIGLIKLALKNSAHSKFIKDRGITPSQVAPPQSMYGVQPLYQEPHYQQPQPPYQQPPSY